MVLARTYAESAKVNEDELKARLPEAMWRQVSQVLRVLDQEALNVAVRNNRVSAVLVDECTLRKRTVKRLLHHATKEEMKQPAAAK